MVATQSRAEKTGKKSEFGSSFRICEPIGTQPALGCFRSRSTQLASAVFRSHAAKRPHESLHRESKRIVAAVWRPQPTTGNAVFHGPRARPAIADRALFLLTLTATEPRSDGLSRLCSRVEPTIITLQFLKESLGCYGNRGLADKQMSGEKLSRLVSVTMIATFAFGSIACYPAFQPSASLFANAASSTSNDTSDDDGSRPMPRSPLAEDISERPLSELIHPPFSSVTLRSPGPNTRAPGEPSILYSMHSSNELLRPPQV